jgi:hypothetical protein
MGKVREAPALPLNTPDEDQVSRERGEMDSYLVKGLIVLLVVRHGGSVR